MLTAKADRAMKIEGLDCGADDYLVKPFDAEELRARVRSLLKLRRLHHDPGPAQHRAGNDREGAADHAGATRWTWPTAPA